MPEGAGLRSLASWLNGAELDPDERPTLLLHDARIPVAQLVLTLETGPVGAQVFRALVAPEEGGGAMKQKRYTDEQIAFALRQAESGTAVAEICRKLGISEPTFYRWKKQFAGMGTVRSGG